MHDPTKIIDFENTLRSASPKYQVRLSDETIARLGQYYALVQHWNPRLHLVAPCSAEEFATRHILESLTLLLFVIEDARAADIGSGAGLPIIPCLIARPSISATLFEASAKKAVFLREAIAQLGLNAVVVADRFERLPAPDVEFVTCRALERFTEMVPEMIGWAPASAKLLLFGGAAIETALIDLGCEFHTSTMPNSDSRYLFVVKPATESRPTTID